MMILLNFIYINFIILLTMHYAHAVSIQTVLQSTIKITYSFLFFRKKINLIYSLPNIGQLRYFVYNELLNFCFVKEEYKKVLQSR